MVPRFVLALDDGDVGVARVPVLRENHGWLYAATWHPGPVKPRIMYIESKADGLTGPARIGRVTFSKTGRTLHYRGDAFRSLKGAGLEKPRVCQRSGCLGERRPRSFIASPMRPSR